MEDNVEKSNSSSFEDLSNLNETELNEAKKAAAEVEAKAAVEDDKSKLPITEADAAKNVDKIDEDALLDIIGNGQLTKKILVKGANDTRPQRGDICKVTFYGKLENGTLVEEEKELNVQVGDLELVQGLDMALPLMNVGEKAEIITDPRFAYGAPGLKNENNPSASVPPGAKIIYELELISCNEECDIEEHTFERRKEIGINKRERGNFWYSRNEYNLAIQLYRRSLEYLNDNGSDSSYKIELTNDQLQELLEIRIKVYNNLAAAQMKICAYDTALQSVDNVLRCQPENVKALFRKGKILESKGDTNAAIPVLQKGATLDPESKAIQQLLSKCILKSRREARNEKDLYQKMLGHAQKLENSKQSAGGNGASTGTINRSGNGNSQQSRELKLWGYLMGSILIGVAGVALYRYNNFL